MMQAQDSPAPSERVLREWTRRAGNEYGSGIVAHHFTLWLLQVGAPPELIRAGLAVVQDEVRHAEACRELLRSLGRDEVPVLAREALRLRRDPDEPLEHDLVRACISGFCIDETLAVTLFRIMRASASVPVIVELAEDFLRDEVHHRELGWVTLRWLLEGPQGEALRVIAEQEVAPLLTRRGAKLCGPSRAEPPTADEQSWGLLRREQYVEVFAQGCGRDVVPRFAELGVVIEPGLVDGLVTGSRA